MVSKSNYQLREHLLDATTVHITPILKHTLKSTSAQSGKKIQLYQCTVQKHVAESLIILITVMHM